jgi:hypothetical protein
MFKTLQDDIATKPEIHTVDLEMGEDAWPFNNRETTVALDILRENICYGVDISVLGYSGGRLGSITVADRALNGFKLIHDGSASQVRVILRITGGMDEAANKQ